MPAPQFPAQGNPTCRAGTRAISLHRLIDLIVFIVLHARDPQGGIGVLPGAGNCGKAAPFFSMIDFDLSKFLQSGG
jgi:hypothetical protein